MSEYLGALVILTPLLPSLTFENNEWQEYLLESVFAFNTPPPPPIILKTVEWFKNLIVLVQSGKIGLQDLLHNLLDPPPVRYAPPSYYSARAIT